MSLFFERPILLLVCGIVVEALLLVALLMSGRAVLLRWMLAGAVLFAVAIGVERFVVTDREQIEILIEDAVRVTLAHDKDGLLKLVDPGATPLRQMVAQVMNRPVLEELVITHQEIELHNAAQPPTATVRLIARVRVRESGGGPPVALVPAVLQLRKSEGWKFTQAEYDTRGLKK